MTVGAVEHRPRQQAAPPARIAAPKPPRDRVPLVEKAYEAIKRKIITLEYRPGQYVNEAAVCKLLKIGRTPVHQAMQRLMHERLVEIIPRKGVIVRPDSLNEILELMEARWVVESYCAGLAVERATPKDVADLERILAAARHHLEAQSIENFMRMDRDFHARVGAIANSILGETLRTLHERSARIWFLQMWNMEDFKRTQAEHEAVLVTIRGGDKEGAVAAMRSHLASLRRRVVPLLNP